MRWADPKIRVDIHEDELVVRFLGADAFWTLKRRLVVPVEQVRGVMVAALVDVPREGFRLPGSSIPGALRAGSFGVSPNRDLWDVRTGPQVLWIELRPGASYRRIILQVTDPHADALALRPVLGAYVPDLV